MYLIITQNLFGSVGIRYPTSNYVEFLLEMKFDTLGFTKGEGIFFIERLMFICIYK